MYQNFLYFIIGPQELKVLVDLAIISAGETDMETTRITCLHTSCLGFAPLIFDLKPSFGFDKLMSTCEPVWSAVDADPTLPDKLVGLVMVLLLLLPLWRYAYAKLDPARKLSDFLWQNDRKSNSVNHRGFLFSCIFLYLKPRIYFPFH